MKLFSNVMFAALASVLAAILPGQSIKLEPGPGTDYMTSPCGSSISATGITEGFTSDGKVSVVVTASASCPAPEYRNLPRTIAACWRVNYDLDGNITGKTLINRRSWIPRVNRTTRACDVNPQFGASYTMTDAANNVIYTTWSGFYGWGAVASYLKAEAIAPVN